jgi:hypothetical protein
MSALIEPTGRNGSFQARRADISLAGGGSHRTCAEALSTSPPFHSPEKHSLPFALPPSHASKNPSHSLSP